MTESIERIFDTFEFLQDWEERYEYIAELGKRLPPIEEQYKNPEHQVQGCMSQVWFSVDVDGATPPHLTFHGESDTAIIQGMVAILVALYSGKTLDEVLATDADKIFHDLGIYDHLSPNRHVGVYAMVEKIRSLARTAVAEAA